MTDRKTVYAVDGIPRREFSLPGAHVRFARSYRERGKTAKAGVIGIVVTDKDGRCKQGRVPVAVAGIKKYMCVPADALEIREVRG